jgi:hypothetical protein
MHPDGPYNHVRPRKEVNTSIYAPQKMTPPCGDISGQECFFFVFFLLPVYQCESAGLEMEIITHRQNLQYQPLTGVFLSGWEPWPHFPHSRRSFVVPLTRRPSFVTVSARVSRSTKAPTWEFVDTSPCGFIDDLQLVPVSPSSLLGSWALSWSAKFW